MLQWLRYFGFNRMGFWSLSRERGETAYVLYRVVVVVLLSVLYCGVV